MHYVSLIVEALRGRPRLVFWAAALTQSFLWVFFPSVFYSAPPGDVPTVFALGVLLMVGIAAFTVPSVDYGPAVLAAPFWALALMHYWLAVGEARRGAWFLLAIDLGLLLLTSYVGLILVGLLALFTLLTTPGRRALASAEPWVSSVLLAIVLFPHAWWLSQQSDLVLSGWQASAAMVGRVQAWAWLAALIAASHLGLGLLVLLATGWPRGRRERAPEIDRPKAAPFGCVYIYVFALTPAIAAVAIAAATGRLGPLDAVAPLVVLSGLAVITAAGDRVLLYRERLVSSAWAGILVVPPLIAVAGIAVVPFVASVDPRVAQPASAEGRFFAETYQRRTGRPLQYVAGDPRVAPLIALAAPSRPHVYFSWAPKWSVWASAEDMRAAGGVLVWPVTAADNAPPKALEAQFPGLVPEVPQSFARPVQGFLPAIRLGWAVLRPESRQPRPKAQ
jgi:hypothetical protein